MKPEIITLSEVTQTQKTNIICFLQYMAGSFETSDMCYSFGILKKVIKIVRGHGE